MDQFDPNIPGLIQGNVTNVTVIDPVQPAPTNLGNLVIDPTQDFTIKIEWEIFGGQVPLYIAAADQSWNVSAYGESIGSSPEILLGDVQRDKNIFVPVPGPLVNHRKYEATVTVLANTLEEHIPGTAQSGIYKLAVAVFLNSNISVPQGFDLIGFKEGPFIQAENPV